MAVVKGILYFVFFYALPFFVVSLISQFAPEIFARYVETLQIFVALLIFFAVAAELTKGTMYHHAFNVGRAIVLLVFFVLAFNGGIIQMTVQGIRIRADLTVYLLMLITVDLMGLAKSLLQAVDFMHEKAEQQLPVPQPVG